MTMSLSTFSSKLTETALTSVAHTGFLACVAMNTQSGVALSDLLNAVTADLL